jgi:hypothetical protein
MGVGFSTGMSCIARKRAATTVRVTTIKAPIAVASRRTGEEFPNLFVEGSVEDIFLPYF